MNFKFLNDADLLVQTKNRVAHEKEVTLEVLHLLSEVEPRKLFLAREFSSLFDFCVQGLNYSEGSAHRRISSMRLLRQIPEIESKIKENKVNPSTLTQLQGRWAELFELMSDVCLKNLILKLSPHQGGNQNLPPRRLNGASIQIVAIFAKP